MSLSVLLSKNEIENLLKDFEFQTKSGAYERIFYSAWKILSKGDRWKIRFGGNNGDITIGIHNSQIGYKTLTFHLNDDGFGDFLESRRDKIMSSYYCTNTTGETILVSSNLKDVSTADIAARVDSSYINTKSTIPIEALSAEDYSCYNTGITTIEPVEPKSLTNEKIFEKHYRNKAEDEKNMNTGIKFTFGTCEKDNIKMSMYGIAIKNAANEWVSYDAKTGDIINVDIFNFDGGKYLFKMPVAIKDIKQGDVIIHNGVPMYVTGLTEGAKNPVVIDPKAGEEKTILPTKNMFGFDFVTKVVPLFDMGNAVAPSKDSPFGNMWPLLLADGNVDPVVLMMMSGNMKDMNPMMMYLLMNNKGNSNSDMGLLLAMMNMGTK